MTNAEHELALLREQCGHSPSRGNCGDDAILVSAWIRKSQDLAATRASFIDRLNTWLRQEMPHPAPQAEMGSELKGFLDLLVFRMQEKLAKQVEKYAFVGHPTSKPVKETRQEMGIESRYTCNGNTALCERQRFGGCRWHEAQEAKVDA